MNGLGFEILACTPVPKIPPLPIFFGALSGAMYSSK